MYLLRELSKIIAIFTLCLGISGCAELTDGLIKGLLEPKEEAKRKQQNPALMIEEIDQQRRSETSQDIERQNQKEEAVKKKQFDEILEKQLRSQPSISGVSTKSTNLNDAPAR